MKKYLIILILFFTGVAAYAQDEGSDDKAGKIRDRMSEYIRDRLGLSRNEAEKFTPVFLKYFQEFRQIHHDKTGISIFHLVPFATKLFLTPLLFFHHNHTWR